MSELERAVAEALENVEDPCGHFDDGTCYPCLSQAVVARVRSHIALTLIVAGLLEKP